MDHHEGFAANLLRQAVQLLVAERADQRVDETRVAPHAERTPIRHARDPVPLLSKTAMRGDP
jgi:hypothetical protein